MESTVNLGVFVESGADARVLEIHPPKSLDDQTVLTAAHGIGALVTAEEHSAIGGLGGAVAELLTARFPVPWNM